jgi:hypothetical protein
MKNEKIKKNKERWVSPETAFGQNIFDSIPRKMDSLTRIYGVKNFRGSYELEDGNTIHWNLKAPSRYIFVPNFGTINWTGKATTPRNTRVREIAGHVNAWIKNIESNLDKFVQLETSVYEAVEKFCEQRQQEERDFQARSAPSVQSIPM